MAYNKNGRCNKVFGCNKHNLYPISLFENMEIEKGTFIREFEIPAISEVLDLYQKVEGDVSCVVWDASMVLSKYLEERFSEKKDFLKDSQVIELGAGLGCVGLTAACLGAQVTSTDLPECIPLLDLNIEQNRHVWSKYGEIMSVALRWGVNDDLGIVPDKILLADCVYYEESIKPLIQTMIDLCGPETEILLCQEMRESENQRKYWKNFMDSLKEHFEIRMIPLSEQNEFYCSPDIILMRMVKKKLC